MTTTSQTPQPAGWKLFILELMMVLTMAIAVTPFLFANGSLDGDGLAYQLLYFDLFRDGFSYSNWVPGPGRGVELVVIIDYFIMYLTGGDLILTSYFSAFLKCLALYATTRLLLNKTLKLDTLQKRLLALTCTVLLVWSFYLLAGTQVVYVTSDTLKLLWYLSLGNLVIYHLFHLLKGGKAYNYLFLTLIALVGISASAKFSAFVIVPILAMWTIVLGLAVIKHHPRKGTIVASLGVLTTTFLAGYFVIFKTLLPKYHVLDSYFPKEFLKLSYTGRRLGLLIESALLSDGILAAFVVVQFIMVLFLLIQAVRILLQVAKSEELDNLLLYRGFFVGLALGTCVVVVVSSLLLTKGDTSRYYMSIPFVLWLATLHEMFHSIKRENMKLSFSTVTALSVGLCFLLSGAFVWALPDLKEAKVSLKEMRAHSPKAGPLQSLTHCLLANQKKFNLKYGLAEYWTARPIQVMSKNRIRVVQINPKTLNFYHFANNAEYFWQGSKQLGKPVYNFIILGFQPVHDEFDVFLRNLHNPKLKELIRNRVKRLKWRGFSTIRARKVALGNSQNINESLVRKIFGAPTGRFVCPLVNGDLRKIWVFHSKKFDTHVKKRFYQQYRAWRKQHNYPYKLKPWTPPSPKTKNKPSTRPSK